MIILQMKMCQCSHDIIKNKFVKKISVFEKLNVEELKIKKTPNLNSKKIALKSTQIKGSK